MPERFLIFDGIDITYFQYIIIKLTSTDIDEILIHYFIYKNIVNNHPEKDRLTPDELFRLSFVGLHLMNYQPDICVSNDKDALEHYNLIKKKALEVTKIKKN